VFHIWPRTYPCGFISLAQGWLVVESKRTLVFMVGRIVLGMQLVGESLLEKISYVCHVFCV
jgi:hypothetical protein